MLDSPPGSRPLPILVTRAVRWALWLVLAAWVCLLLVWGAFEVFIVPRIPEWRGELEARASQALGVPVRIGRLQVRSEGVTPSFELLDVRLYDASGREALQLPQVLAALSMRSIWSLGFEQLLIDRPQLDVRRTRDGRILVAGLDLAQSQDDKGRGMDWFFAQTELALRGGAVSWTDEMHDAGAPLRLSNVDLMFRNRGHSHSMRLDATPPSAWGQRFSVQGEFRQPLLSWRAGDWRQWKGQLYAAFEQVELAELGRYAQLGLRGAQGRGALRAWLEVAQGEPRSVVADVALADVHIGLSRKLPPLALNTLTGRLSARRVRGGFELATQALRFETADGLRWPGGNARLKILVDAASSQPQGGELEADNLDLGALSQLAQRLPIDPKVHAALTHYAPEGLVERIAVRWQGSLESLERYSAQGRVVNLAVAPQAASVPPGAAPGSLHLGRPGVHGAQVDFDLDQSEGHASVNVQQGDLAFPGLFEEPVVALDQLSSDVRWQWNGAQLAVQLPNLHFANADAAGEAQVKWQMGDGQGDHDRFPGVLDLQGTLSRTDVTRVHRYLPLLIVPQVRSYLRDAVQGGRGQSVRFRLRGDLKDMPFTDPRQGEFRIQASVRAATFAFLPPSVQATGERPWPTITQMDGELLIEGNRLQWRGASGYVGASRDLRISRSDGQIVDLDRTPVLSMSAQARGPLQDALQQVVVSSPLAEMSGHVLDQASASEAADYQFKLHIPLDRPEQTRVQGNVSLANNDVRLGPEWPRMSRVRGVVHFSEQGFALSGVQGRCLGGELRGEGGSMAVPGTKTAPVLRLQGQATAEGLRQARELGLVSRLAQQASGAANYTATVHWRRGLPEMQLTSSLQGLVLNLPAPWGKSAEASVPLRLETALWRDAPAGPAGATAAPNAPKFDRLSLELGRLASAVYVRDISGPQPRVLRGVVNVGLPANEAMGLPGEGVSALLQLGQLDLDVWRRLLNAPQGAARKEAEKTADKVAAEKASEDLAAYVPSRIALRASELVLEGRRLNQLVAGASREGSNWRVNLAAQELDGHIEYRPSGSAAPGRVFARLARLSLGPSSAQDVESLLDEQPASIPALDIVVDDMDLRGKKLGRVEVEAINRGALMRDGGVREWRLSKFNISNPEASFTATGNWAQVSEPAGAAGRMAGKASSERRRTVMNFKLDLQDAGGLLARLGMRDVFRRGKGHLEGQVAWLGSPLTVDVPSLGGHFNVNVENGQFLKADPGMAKLLSVLSLQSLPRRFTLDFRDVFSEGFAFDFVRGDVQIEQGVASTNNLQMKGVNAAVLMEGRADIARETQDLRVVVVPEINAGTASVIASVINPAVGLGTFLAQLFIRKPLIEAATQEFHIDGSWIEPRIQKSDGRDAAAP